MKKKFLPISLLYCLDILTSIKHNPVTCVFTFITLFALQLPAGHISLVGSEKEGVIKKQYISDLLQFKIEKRTNNQTKEEQDKTEQTKKKRTATNIVIKNIFAAGPEW